MIFKAIISGLSSLLIIKLVSGIKSDLFAKVAAIVFMIMVIYVVVLSGGALSGLAGISLEVWAVLITSLILSVEQLLEWVVEAIKWLFKLILELVVDIIKIASDTLGLGNLLFYGIAGYVGIKILTNNNPRSNEIKEVQNESI